MEQDYIYEPITPQQCRLRDMTYVLIWLFVPVVFECHTIGCQMNVESEGYWFRMCYHDAFDCELCRDISLFFVALTTF